MARENYRTPFSRLCQDDLDDISMEVMRAIDNLEMHGEYVMAGAVTSLSDLVNDMIEYLKKENH